MARVLLLSLVFPPDGVSTAQLMGELVEDLRAGGHDVDVITTQPHYNRDASAESVQPLTRLRGGLLLESRFRDIRVLHTAMPADRTRFSGRLLGWASFHLLGFFAALRMVQRPDVILVPSPLLTAGVIAWLINVFRGGRFIYNVQELYPDLAVQMGRLRNPLMILALQRLERFVYHRAGAITAIAQSIYDRIAQRGVPRAKLHLIPNFVDLDDLVPVSRYNGFAREHDLEDSFVLSYAGNLGYAQGLETIIEAAEACSDHRVRFVLIGSGVLSDHLAEQVRKRGLQNVILIGYQPYTRMPEIYGASDLCLVPLLGEVGASALPSKVFRIMACERPIVAMCDPSSELADVVRSSGAGVIVRSGSAAELLEAISGLVHDSSIRAAMGRAGRDYVRRFYSREVVTDRYVNLVQALSET